MILSLFILIEIVLIAVFFIAFFTKHELLWGISAALSGVLMVVSYNVQIAAYVYDTVTSSYVHQLVSYSFPVMMGINMLFFVLTILLALLDAFDKYGLSTLDFKTTKLNSKTNKIKKKDN